MAAGGISRVSDQMRTNTLLTNLRSNTLQSQTVQRQLATGDRLLVPSDDPDAANQIMSLQRIGDLGDQVLANLEKTDSIFSQTDSCLGEAATLLLDAGVLASDSIGATSDERETAAQMIQSLIDSLISLANTKVGDTYIFAGTASTEPAFVCDLDGVRYAGNDQACTANLGGTNPTAIGLTGAEVFGMEEAGMLGIADLTPAMTADTRLMDLDGTCGTGIRLDVITINDGTNTIRVDLTGADRVGDVIDKINDAAGGLVTAAIAPGGTGIELTATTAGADLTVTEAGAGMAAHDLGLFRQTGQGTSFTGDSVNPTLTETTSLADLAGGTGLDLASGLTISNGGSSATIDFASDSTVGDMLNRINNAGVGVTARINATGTGIDIINTTGGAALRISENGGTTAEDLGVRTLHGGTALAELNDGCGVYCYAGETDMRITARDGATFEVDLSAAVTIDDAVDAINAAATAAGVTVTASLRTTGNGIELTDATGGTGNLSAISINGGSAAADLGLDQSVNADVLSADDTNPVNTGGIFSHLTQLRDALLDNDDAEITRVAQLVDEDYDNLVSLRGRMGGLVQDLERRYDRTEGLMIDNTSMLSDLKDIDFAEAITEFQALQTALQANLMTSSQMLSLSLLDFLA